VRRRRVKFIGATDAQVRWGDNDDPRGILDETRVYEVVKIDMNAWNTRIKLVGFPDYWFNVKCFEEVKDV